MGAGIGCFNLPCVIWLWVVKVNESLEKTQDDIIKLL